MHITMHLLLTAHRDNAANGSVDHTLKGHISQLWTPNAHIVPGEVGEVVHDVCTELEEGKVVDCYDGAWTLKVFQDSVFGELNVVAIPNAKVYLIELSQRCRRRRSFGRDFDAIQWTSKAGTGSMIIPMLSSEG